MAKKRILNDKIILLSPKMTNDFIKIPILLLNNNFDISNLKIMVVDKNNKIAVLITNDNIERTDQDIYYFPISLEIINELIYQEKRKIIINNGYLDDFTEKDSVVVKFVITEELEKNNIN